MDFALCFFYLLISMQTLIYLHLAAIINHAYLRA